METLTKKLISPFMRNAGNGQKYFQLLTIFAKKLHLRCLTGFSVDLWNEMFLNIVFKRQKKLSQFAY